jgi:hypothetical protein
VYYLLDPETYGQEGYSNKSTAVYKKWFWSLGIIYVIEDNNVNFQLDILCK